MSNIDRYLSVCDPLPVVSDRIKGWRKVVQGVARIILDSSKSSSWEMAECLASIIEAGRLGSDEFSTRVVEFVARTLPDSTERNHLFNCVCAMSATIRVLENRRLSATAKVSRRDSIALALWSALSFQRSLPQLRLEDVRADMLNSARRTGLELAQSTRTRQTSTYGPSSAQQPNALRWNAALDQEEITVLRWTLADESSLLERPYADVRCDVSVAVARGLDLGRLLSRIPVFEHFKLASRDIVVGQKIDLGGLVDSVGEDRNALAAPYVGNPIIDACPTTFPLLTALRGGSTGGDAAGAVRRSLADWCGRALLESAIIQRSEQSREGT